LVEDGLSLCLRKFRQLVDDLRCTHVPSIIRSRPFVSVVWLSRCRVSQWSRSHYVALLSTVIDGRGEFVLQRRRNLQLATASPSDSGLGAGGARSRIIRAGRHAASARSKGACCPELSGRFRFPLPAVLRARGGRA